MNFELLFLLVEFGPQIYNITHITARQSIILDQTINDHWN
jgi:hypothetical protein